jgi:CBS domain-containing protein
MSSESRHYSVRQPYPAFEKATVADVMRPGVMSCPPNTSLVTVAQTMTAHNIHAVVVSGLTAELVAGDQVAWGMLSDMDLMRAVLSGIRDRRARDYTRSDAVAIQPSATLLHAAALMIKHDTAHLVVTDIGRPIGMVSTLDVAASLALG